MLEGDQVITIGRQGLCSYNGLNSIFTTEISITHNLDYDPRFSQYVPLIKSI